MPIHGLIAGRLDRASLQLPAVRDAITRAKPLIAQFGLHQVTEPVGGVGLAPAERVSVS